MSGCVVSRAEVDGVAACLRALRDGDRDGAAAAARTTPGPLAAALVRHLCADRTGAPYDEPSAFRAFADNGGNRRLYARTTAALAALHASLRPRSVLDVGCGDGRVTAAVVGPWTESVELVEPSAALLARAEEALAGARATIRAHRAGAAEVVREGSGAWELVQSTFALSAMEPAGRRSVLAALAPRSGALAVVEFDVPHLDGGARLRRLVERYAVGVREYADHPAAVDGFLMPLLVGQVEPGRPRHVHEQAAADWERELREAGWRRVAARPVDDYWWAPAILLTAAGGSGGARRRAPR